MDLHNCVNVQLCSLLHLQLFPMLDLLSGAVVPYESSVITVTPSFWEVVVSSGAFTVQIKLGQLLPHVYHFTFMSFGFIWHFSSLFGGLPQRGKGSVVQGMPTFTWTIGYHYQTLLFPLFYPLLGLRQVLWYGACRNSSGRVVLPNSSSRNRRGTFTSFCCHCVIFFPLFPSRAGRPVAPLAPRDVASAVIARGLICWSGLLQVAPLACLVCFCVWPSRSQEHFYFPHSYTTSASQRMTYWF